VYGAGSGRDAVSRRSRTDTRTSCSSASRS
jgi:hypothetical protein